MEMTLQRQQPHPFLKIRVSSSSVSFYEQLSFTDLLQCSSLTTFYYFPTALICARKCLASQVLYTINQII